MVTGRRPGTGYTEAREPSGPAGAGTTQAATAWERELRRLAGSVPDPELPMLTLEELGVLRSVQVTGSGRVEVELSPTYTGCPAVETMSADIEQVLHDHGAQTVTVRRVLSPPWTTDDISDEGRRKLRESGIAPPRTGHVSGPVTVPLGQTRTTTTDRAQGGTPAEAQDGALVEARNGAPAEARVETRDGPPEETHPKASGSTAERGTRRTDAVCCPYCGSDDTELLSRFSSTACKALRRCLACREPFDHFKEV